MSPGPPSGSAPTGSRRGVRPFGDSAVVAGCASSTEAHALAAAVRRRAWPGVEEVVVGHRSVTVITDPTVADVDALGEELAAVAVDPTPPAPGRVVDIPVSFDGPDVAEVAAAAGMAPAGVVAALTGARLRVAFLGFLPGFAYLEGLPGGLAAVPRRPSPRVSVAAGSVAVAGGFAGIYPQASPGGWQVVGRTGITLFDPHTAPFARLQPGDVVRLRATDDPGAAPTAARPALRPPAGVPGRLTVEDPGLLSMVQDLGRRGVAALGVPRAGAADPYALRVGNRLVGNPEGAAGIEVTGHGPRLCFAVPAHVAVIGRVGTTLDGLPVPADTVVPVTAGQVLAVGTTAGHLRAYVVVAGGLALEPVLGSMSSDVLTGLGPGPLRAGDELGIGAPTRPRGRVERVRGGPLELPDEGTVRRLRVTAGPDRFDPGELERLGAVSFEVGTASDRVGVRLAGGDRLAPPAPGIASRAVITGAVQVPPDGEPVALLCDHATVGGYPVVGAVVSADTGVLGGCRPGDRVRLEMVDGPEARRAREAAERAVGRAALGWYPVRSD